MAEKRNKQKLFKTRTQDFTSFDYSWSSIKYFITVRQNYDNLVRQCVKFWNL